MYAGKILSSILESSGLRMTLLWKSLFFTTSTLARQTPGPEFVGIAMTKDKPCLTGDETEQALRHSSINNEQLIEKMRAALQEFVDRVDKGQIISKYHYKKFKDILSEME